MSTKNQPIWIKNWLRGKKLKHKHIKHVSYVTPYYKSQLIKKQVKNGGF